MSSNNWKIRPIQWTSVMDNELSSRYYQMLLRWIPFANKHFQEWNDRPNCGYFFGGCNAYGTDTSYIAAIFAVLSKVGKYDPKITGVPRQQLMEKAIKGIRYLGLTHEEGPADCVRVEGKDPFYSRKKWGRKDEDYFRATQTGRSVAALCLAARFLWDEMDGETKELVHNVAASYADRWCGERPKSGTYNDTQEEENAWTAMGISAALDLFPEHPRHEQWKQGFIRWSAGSVTTFRDCYIRESIHRAQTPRTQDVDMFPVHAVTLHPDYSTENHGFVHPGYIISGIVLRSMHVVSALAGGSEILASALYNNEEIYDRMIKLCAQKDGFIVPIQGQDWWYNHQYGPLVGHTVLNVVHRHPEAASLERNALERVENIQKSNSNGCFMEENGDECILNPMQTIQDFERPTGFCILLCYLLHAFGGEGAEPADQEEMRERSSGVYYYPYGSFIMQRTKHSISSFSWRSNVMAFTLPEKGMWSFTPLFTNYTGVVQFEESKGIKGLSNEIRVRDVERYNIQPTKDGFSAVATIARGDRELLQDIAFIALPDGRTVYAEQFRAVKSCSIRDMQTGMIGIRNERYAALPDVASGEKTVYFPAGSETFKGFYGGAPDDIRTYPAEPYLNVNDEMGFVLFGSHGVKYVNRHEYPTWKGVEDILVLNDIGGRNFREGETLLPFVVLSAPNQTAVETARLAEETKCLISDAEHTIVMETSGYLVYAHFNDTDRIVKVRKDINSQPFSLYAGNNRIEGAVYTWCDKVPAYRSGYLPSEYQIEIEPTAGVCLDFSVMADRIVITNPSPQLIRFTLTRLQDGKKREMEIPANGYDVFFWNLEEFRR